MSRPLLSVAMIVKNEEKNLPIALQSLNGIADELIIVDTGSTDKTKEIAESFGAKVFDLKLEPFNFAEARNFSFSKCTGEWIFWFDADDILVNPDGVKKQIEVAGKLCAGYTAIYNYAFDKSGKCISRHDKERLIRNDGSFEWKGVLHEAMVPLRTINAERTTFFEVSHAKDQAGFEASSKRNYDIISKWVEQEGVYKTDPRNVLSLANACLGLAKYEEAIEYFKIFSTISGWVEEIYISLHRAAICARMLQRYQDAVELELQAIKTDPKTRDAYIGLGQTFMEMSDWLRAEHWLLQSFSKMNQKKAVIHNPMEYEFNPWWMLAHVYFNLAMDGKGEEYVEKALACFEKCSEQLENDDDVQERVKILKEQQRQIKLAESVLHVGSELRAESEELFQKFVDVVPPSVAGYPTVWKMRNSVIKKKETSGKDLIIFCGHCFEPWDPTYLETGVGGSEEAVIHMAQELTQKGWTVTVYNGVPKEQVFDGVTYRPFWCYNPQEPTDVFIGWRQPALWDVFTPNTKKNYLWLHDVVQDTEFTEARLKKIDKVFVLSKFHRSLFPSIPEDKIWYSSNGLYWPDMEIEVERKPWKLVNTSAPDRGIHKILELWPRIRERYPQAELYWYYGWQTFDNYNAQNPERMAFKAQIVKLLEQAGVHFGGRIGHKEIAKEMASADAWVYPTEFPEISCISAMKAQAVGAMPICTNFGALKETVKNGIKIESDHFYSDAKAQEEFIEAIGKAHLMTRENLKESARDFSWEKVADDWDQNMLR